MENNLEEPRTLVAYCGRNGKKRRASDCTKKRVQRAITGESPSKRERAGGNSRGVRKPIVRKGKNTGSARKGLLHHQLRPALKQLD